MSKIHLKKQIQAEPLQISGIRKTVTVDLASGGASASVALPSGAKAIELNAEVDCYLNLGDNAVTASSSSGKPLWAKSPVVYRVLSGQTHAAIQHPSNSGTVWITEATTE